MYNKNCSPDFNYVTIYDVPENFREVNLLAGESQRATGYSLFASVSLFVEKITLPHKYGFLFVDYM